MPGRTAEQMAERRARLGWTQQQLADLVGVKLSMVADCESGRGSLTGEGAAKLWEAIETAEAERKAKSVRQLFIECRLALDLSQEELARRSSLDPLQFSKWEAQQFDFDDVNILAGIEDALDAAATERGLPAGFVEKASHRESTPLSALLGGETTKVFGRLQLLRGAKPKRRSFAERRLALEDLRKEAGLSLKELASKANIPESDLRKFEAGQRDLDSKSYCALFDAALDVVLEKEKTKPRPIVPPKKPAMLKDLLELGKTIGRLERIVSKQDQYIQSLEKLIRIQEELLAAYVEAHGELRDIAAKQKKEKEELEHKIKEYAELVRIEGEMAVARETESQQNIVSLRDNDD